MPTKPSFQIEQKSEGCLLSPIARCLVINQCSSSSIDHCKSQKEGKKGGKNIQQQVFGGGYLHNYSSADLRLVYSIVDGIPDIPHSMVVYDRFSSIWNID